MPRCQGEVKTDEGFSIVWVRWVDKRKEVNILGVEPELVQRMGRDL